MTRVSLAALAASIGLLVAAPSAIADVAYPYLMYGGSGYAADSGTVKLTLPSIDDSVVPVTLPFSFSIFGHQYLAGSTVHVSTNGVLQFENSSSAWTNTPLPATATFPGPAIMAYWDDLMMGDDPDPIANPGIWIGTAGTAPNRRFVIKWHGYVRASDPIRRLSVALELHEGTNRIDIAWFRNLTDPMADGSGATIGIQEGVGGEFVQYSYNTAGVGTGGYVSFTPRRPAITSAPAVSGTATVGQTQTTTTGTWVGDPHAYNYSWGRCTTSACSSGATTIPGATSQTYVVTTADAGKWLVAFVTASNGWGPAADEAWSNRVGPVPTAPITVAGPTLTGTPVVGATLALSDGTWSGSPTAYEYKWWRCEWAGSTCAPSVIAGATSKTYVPVAGDVGDTVYGQVRAYNSSGWSSWASSNSLSPVQAAVVPAPEYSVPPSVAGDSRVDSTLTLNRGTWSGAPDAFAQQWLRCVPTSAAGCTPQDIAGATELTYVLATADVSSLVYALVRAHNSGGWSSWASTNSIGPVWVPTTPVAPVKEPWLPDAETETGEDEADDGQSDKAQSDERSSSTAARVAVLGLDVVPSTFRAARRGSSIGRRGGTKVTFRLLRPGPVVFRVERRATGRKVGTRCVARTRRNRSRQPCTRWVRVTGSFTWNPAAGATSPYSFRFTGRINGKSLKAGRYRLVAVATGSGDTRSAPGTHAFRVRR